MNELTKEERETLEEIKAIYYIYYMQPMVQRIDEWLAQYSSEPKTGWVKVLDQLYNILRNAQSDIEKLLDRRIEQGKIKNKDQARKSIAGNAFCNSLIYIFLQNKIYGDITFTSLHTKPKSLKLKNQ